MEAQRRAWGLKLAAWHDIKGTWPLAQVQEKGRSPPPQTSSPDTPGFHCPDSSLSLPRTPGQNLMGACPSQRLPKWVPSPPKGSGLMEVV